MRCAVGCWHYFSCNFLIPLVFPAFAPCLSARLVRFLDFLHELLFRKLSKLWGFHLVSVVDCSCRMVLRLEQCVKIVEFLRQERALHFVKAQFCQLSADLLQERKVRMFFSSKYFRNWVLEVVLPERLSLPSLAFYHCRVK